jgi:hypothetical protein
MLRSLPQGLAAFPMLKLGRLRITVFEACSTFTRVTACILAESPGDPLHRRLQPPVLVRLLRLLPAGAPVAGWASPTGRPCLRTAHFNSLLVSSTGCAVPEVVRVELLSQLEALDTRSTRIDDIERRIGAWQRREVECAFA